MKTPISRLLQGAGLSCCALVVGIFFGLFLTPYMLEKLGEDAYGVYALASLFAGWCGLLDFGMTTTVSRYVTRYFTKGDRVGVNETGSTAIVLFGGIASLVLGLACAASGGVKFLGPAFDNTGVLGNALFFAGVAFAVSKISDGVCGVIKGALRQELTGAANLCFRIIFGLVNFVVLWSGGRVVALFVANLVMTFLQLVAYIIIVRIAVPTFTFSFHFFRKKRVRSLFGYSFYTFLIQAGEIAVNRSDLIVIAALMSTSEVARYNLVVVTLVSYFNSFIYETSSWQINWFARLAALEYTQEDWREQNVELKKNKKNISDWPKFKKEFYDSRDAIARGATYFSIFLAFAVFAFAKPFIVRWIGPQYLDALPALALYVLTLGVYRGVAESNAKILQGLAKHRILALAAILHGILNIILSVAFIKCGLGLLGVALGSVLPGFIIHYCWIPNVVCRVIGEEKSVYWTRQFKTTAIAFIAILAPGWIVQKWASPNYAGLFVLAGIAFILYALVVYRIGLDGKERRNVLNFILLRVRRVGKGLGNRENNY